MTGEICWKCVSNASHFLDDAIDELQKLGIMG